MTNVKVFRPEIGELLSQVQKKFGRQISTPSDYFELSMALEALKHPVSIATLKRMWGYVTDVHQPRLATLNALAVYVGHPDFDSFCEWLKTSTDYNSSFFLNKQLSISDLNVGDKVEIGWAPNRIIRLTYQGNALFRVEESRNSKLQAGDCFETGGFVMGQPLILPYILRDGERTDAYLAGKQGGLTLLKHQAGE